MQRLVFTFFILSFSVFANELDAPSFTMFKQLLKEANRLQSVIGSRAISLLAPTNQAFKELSTEQINELINNKDELIAFVDYHIIEHSLSFNRLKNSKALKSKSNKLIKVSNKNSDILINDSFVLSVDVQRKGPTVVAIDKILNYQNQVSYNPQTEPNIDLNKYLGTCLKSPIDQFFVKVAFLQK
ncbi:MAG: fasciclin domain-containing protein [Halobacteriovoraceae bacterium]|nr:fasciclin domain-containing protein [Halobacteriovoraceae bacterium]